MAFVQTNVNYAAEYSRAVANAYPYYSYFAPIWASENSNLYKSGYGKTMYIPSFEVKGAHATDRDAMTGAFARNWNNSLQPVTLEMDREWETLIDPMDIVETNDVATIANITKTFNELQKIPEMDAYLAAKLFAAVTPDTTALTAANILTTWDGYLESLTNARVNRDRVTAYMTPGTYKLLKEAAGLTRFIDTAEGFRGVDRNVARLDGVNIREVPANLMKSSYVFTEGFVPATGAKQINLILADADAVAAPVKYETAMMSAPTAQSKGKYLYYERYYYGAFVLAQRTGGVIVNADS
jgi:hypothetical protein